MSSLPISLGLVGWISWLFLALAYEVTSAQESSDKTASKVQAWVPGVVVERLAEHPDLVTPTGIDLDSQGNIWVVSSHTHFRPSSYQGPEFDEILVFDSEGKNRRVFYNKTKATMQLLWGPDGWLYVAQRDRILRVKDSDNDGVGDTEETIAGLDTLADYPHNGLSGMTWHTDGGLIFSLGENFGKDQKFWDFPCCSGRAKKDPSPEAPTSTSNLKSGSWMRHSLRTSVRGEALRSSLLVKSKQNVGRTLTTRN